MNFNAGELIGKEKNNSSKQEELRLQVEQEKTLRESAIKILQNASKEALKKRLGALADSGKTFLNARGKNLLNAEIFYMASVAGKHTIEDDFIISDLMEMERKGEDVVLADAYKNKISAEVEAADLHQLVFEAFAFNVIEREIANLKKAFKEKKLYQQELREIDENGMLSLKERIMNNLLKTSSAKRDFLELRSRKPDAPLEISIQDEIEALIHEEVSDELIVEEIPIVLNLPKILIRERMAEIPAVEHVVVQETQEAQEMAQALSLDANNNNQIDNSAEGEAGMIKVDNVTVEVDDNAAENKFEINLEQKVALEEELLRAFLLIEEIEGDELDIDFMPAEKHFAGNLKDKIGELLNRSGVIDENPVGEEAEKYWEELKALQSIEKEINTLEQKKQICVTYEGNTFFINKKQELPEIDLKEITAGIVSEKYLSAFIFGVRGDYEKYVSALKANPKWSELDDEEMRELKEKGIVYYVDEILNENEISTTESVRRNICKYAFSILNK